MRMPARLLARAAMTAVLVLPVAALVPLPAAAAAEPMVSEYAFGYNVAAVPRQTVIKSVSAVWEVPAATRHLPGTDVNQWASDEVSWTFMSLGGGCLTYDCYFLSDPSLIVGTESSISADGVPTYRAWYQIPPLGMTAAPLTVRPGDRIRGTIDRPEGLPVLWRLTLHNLTTGAKWMTTTPYVAGMASAQFLVESMVRLDEFGEGYAEMPNLTDVHFDELKINNANLRLRPEERVVFLPAYNTDILGVPSMPQPDGNGFAACAWTTTCAVPPNF